MQQSKPSSTAVLPVCISWLVSGCTQCIVAAAAGVGQAASPIVARCTFAHPACADVSASDVEACIHALRRPRYRTCPLVWGRWLAELEGGKGEPAAKEMVTEGDVRRELQDRLRVAAAISVARQIAPSRRSVDATVKCAANADVGLVTRVQELTDALQATNRLIEVERLRSLREEDAEPEAVFRAFQWSAVTACLHRSRAVAGLGDPTIVQLNPAVKRRTGNVWKAFTKGIAAHPDAPIIIGFHGTPNPGALLHEGFDPSRRAGQAFGPGEYFDKDLQTSKTYASQTASGGIIATAILDVAGVTAHENDGSYLVVNNPIDRAMTYSMPLAFLNAPGCTLERLLPADVKRDRTG